MSQDNPTPQPPNPRSRQQRYQRRLPFWKVKIIQFLRGTIGVLETTVNQLEDPSSRVGGGIIAALTGIIAFIAVIVVWTTSSFNSKPAPQIATVPPETPPVTVTPEPVPTPLVEETPLPTIQETPVALPAKEPQVEETPIAVETPQPEIEQTPVAEVTPEPTPAPTPTPEFIPLTPEQTLIAAIENKVSQVSNNTFSGIVKSIKANFRSSCLIVTISDDWYTLKKSQQDKLAAEMLQRSQELDFTHLEIFDSQDKLVARNPVIGNEMIIFQRQLT